MSYRIALSIVNTITGDKTEQTADGVSQLSARFLRSMFDGVLRIERQSTKRSNEPDLKESETPQPAQPQHMTTVAGQRAVLLSNAKNDDPRVDDETAVKNAANFETMSAKAEARNTTAPGEQEAPAVYVVAAPTDGPAFIDLSCQADPKAKQGQPIECLTHAAPMREEARCSYRMRRDERQASVKAYEELSKGTSHHKTVEAVYTRLIKTARTELELWQSGEAIASKYGSISKSPRMMQNALTSQRDKVMSWEEMISTVESCEELSAIEKASPVIVDDDLSRAVTLKWVKMTRQVIEKPAGGLQAASKEDQRLLWQRAHWVIWVEFSFEPKKKPLHADAVETSREWGYDLNFTEEQITQIEEDAQAHVDTGRRQRSEPINVL